jgi:hypothetical protein
VRLVDLAPQLVRHELRAGREVHVYVDSLDTAQGVRFTCPGCDGHQILVWFKDRGVPDTAEPRPRWSVTGTSLADLTLSPSINLDVPGATGCRWHGFITAGTAR